MGGMLTSTKLSENQVRLMFAYLTVSSTAFLKSETCFDGMQALFMTMPAM